MSLASNRIRYGETPGRVDRDSAGRWMVGAVALDDTAAFEALVSQPMVAPVVGSRFPFLEERMAPHSDLPLER